MKPASMSERTVKALRAAALVAGVLLIAISLLADKLGLSIGQGISRNQLALAAVGVFLVLAGILGRVFPRFWKGLALLLLNAVVALLLLDMLSLLFLKALSHESLPSSLPRERIEGIRKAQGASVWGAYTPYVIWRSSPLQIGEEGTDSLGNRLTTGISDAPDAFEVLVFGGSAAWGAGVPDSATVPSFLQQELEERLSIPIRVINLGQISWVTTQEVIHLSLLLRDGWTPEIVVCYDGFNDVCTAFRYGGAGLHWDYPQVRDMLEGVLTSRLRSRAFAMLLEETSTYQLLRRMDLAGPLSAVEERGDSQFPVARESLLADGVASVYAANMSFTDDLGAARSFRVCHVLQPTIWTGLKVLTIEEETLLPGVAGFQRDGDNSLFLDLLGDSYDGIRTAGALDPGFLDMTGVFDTVSTDVYTDAAGCHLNPSGNRIVAERIARFLAEGGFLPSADPSAAGAN